MKFVPTEKSCFAVWVPRFHSSQQGNERRLFEILKRYAAAPDGAPSGLGMLCGKTAAQLPTAPCNLPVRSAPPPRFRPPSLKDAPLCGRMYLPKHTHAGRLGGSFFMRCGVRSPYPPAWFRCSGTLPPGPPLDLNETDAVGTVEAAGCTGKAQAITGGPPNLGSPFFSC